MRAIVNTPGGPAPVELRDVPDPIPAAQLKCWSACGRFR